MESIVYSTLRFRIHGGDFRAMSLFLTSISTNALRSIRHISLHWGTAWPLYRRNQEARRKGVILDPSREEETWKSIWQIISSSCSLHSLQIVIFDRGFVVFEDELLEPVRAAKTTTFTVQIPWIWGYSDYVSWVWHGLNPNYRGVRSEDSNFQIIRPSCRDEMVVYLAPGPDPTGRIERPLSGCLMLVLFFL
jgi:hypothetical protein